MTRRIVTVSVLVLFTAILLLAGCARQGAQEELQREVDRLEAENTTLRTEKEDLQNRVAGLEAELAELRGQQPGAITRKPKEGWEQYFPEGKETTLAGESTERVRQLLGEPPVLIRSIAASPQFNREIWVFMPFEEDPTGLYLFFKADKLDSSMLNEFNGLYNSGLLDLEEFWLQ